MSFLKKQTNIDLIIISLKFISDTTHQWISSWLQSVYNVILTSMIKTLNQVTSESMKQTLKSVIMIQYLNNIMAASVIQPLSEFHHEPIPQWCNQNNSGWGILTKQNEPSYGSFSAKWNLFILVNNLHIFQAGLFSLKSTPQWDFDMMLYDVHAARILSHAISRRSVLLLIIANVTWKQKPV